VSVTAVLAKTAGAQGVIPTAVTAYRGQQAMFNCSGSSVRWFQSPTSKIFDSPSTWHRPQGNKYDIIGNYNLLVKNLDPASDGGTYQCDTNEVSDNLLAADLVVIGNAS